MECKALKNNDINNTDLNLLSPGKEYSVNFRQVPPIKRTGGKQMKVMKFH